MPTLQDAQTWKGRTLVDRDGDKIGSIEDIYLDRSSGEPEWVAVKTGLFGSNVSFVPIGEASAQGADEIRVPYEKDLVKDAPNVEADGELSPEEEQRLYQHYGRSDYGDWDQTSDRTEGVLGRDERLRLGHALAERVGEGRLGQAQRVLGSIVVHQPTTSTTCRPRPGRSGSERRAPRGRRGRSGRARPCHSSASRASRRRTRPRPRRRSARTRR